ncbi:unnamed protein product [Ascophyllum nodosum]
MCFCVQNAQAWRRIIFFCKFNQKLGWTTATTQTLHKPPPARSLQDYFLASSKGWQRGQPTKANSLIGEDFCDEKFLSSEEIFCLYCLCIVFSACIFVYCRISYFSRFAAEAGTKGEMSHFLDAPDA